MTDSNPSSSPNTPLALETARARIHAAVTPIGETATLELPAACHRVLAEDWASTTDVPGSANAAVDGYGVDADAKAGDTLTIGGESSAGHPFSGTLRVGECVRILTGAWVPNGVDAVVMQEDTHRDDRRVTLDKTVESGANIRPAGEDMVRGETVRRAGDYLRPADLGVLASAGAAEIRVYRRPRIALFSSGDELRPLGEPLSPGQIYDSNRHVLAAMIAELGFETIDLGNAEDDPEALQATFEQARQADAIVTAGGVSVGDTDYVRDVVQQIGKVDLWRVAIKPGKPLAFGHIGRALFFGLPGNPVSAAVTFVQMVRPALVTLAGGRPAPAQRYKLPISKSVERKPGRTEFLRARLSTTECGEPTATPVDHQGSGVMRSLSEADCFIILPRDSAGANSGESVLVEPFAQPVWAHGASSD